MSAPLPPRGRGTASNPLNRFAPTHSEAFDDGWEQDVPPIQLTEVREEIARTVISRNQSPDLPFDRSINPYRGCEHGCLCHAIRHYVSVRQSYGVVESLIRNGRQPLC